uniref:Uncharacterized protein n=1 Tax=viral metagenome TaxID=1070528 RepID=A0A6H2A513_9ZZZZ
MDKEELKCMNKTLNLLDKTREEFDRIWEKAGFDLAYFNVNINLKIIVNDVKVQIIDSWRSILKE